MSEFKIELNSITKKLPKHLQKYIVKQPYAEYTAQDQAVWRYVMKANIDYLQHVAHESFLPGLAKSGITTDEIPQMEGMNRILKDIGWAAVAVDGFIPPAVFMEFQANNVLVISADIRTIEHIKYTPAPDIIHESAGHAPIIAKKEYSNYLKVFGEIGAKAISKPIDDQLFKAIRHLSILKENPNSSKKEIDSATETVEHLQKNIGQLSEMAKVRNLHWWTVEYGLIGSLENPKIYGAGLLSSISESQECLEPDISKIPYSLKAAEVNFDITTAQPQLFVTESFKQLNDVLEEFASTMAFKTGGLSGINKLIESEKLGTVQLSSGLQISGIFAKVLHENNQPIYLQSSGPSSLSCDNKELNGHDKSYHQDGFGSPVGSIVGLEKSLEDCSDEELEKIGIIVNQNIEITFDSGVHVNGKLISMTRSVSGKLLLLTFDECKVKLDKQTLFEPEWGIYDMAVGETITSCFAGPASYQSFEDGGELSSEKPAAISYSKEQLNLHSYYKEVKSMRENDNIDSKRLHEIFKNLQTNYPNDWLLSLEILELSKDDQEFAQKITFYLKKLTNFKGLVSKGLDLY